MNQACQKSLSQQKFFKLDLIQSYGSGTRRAKTEMNRIGSPALMFDPDNETDEYTVLTAYINEWFACVKAEEEGQRMTKTGTKNGTEVLPEKVVAFLMNYANKKRWTAEDNMRVIFSDSSITIPRKAEISVFFCSLQSRMNDCTMLPYHVI